SPAGWEIFGYSVCDSTGNNCSDVGMNTSLSVSPNSSRVIRIKYRPIITLTNLTVACGQISGGISPTMNNIQIEGILKDTWGAEQEHSLGTQGSPFNFNNLAGYQDGRSRRVILRVSYDSIVGSGPRQTTSIEAPTQFNCPNN